jgi:hypothetical protein
VQVIKYQNHNLGPLSLFLISRALRNRPLLGQALFWLIVTELANPEFRVRYSLLLEAYLAACDEHKYHDALMVVSFCSFFFFFFSFFFFVFPFFFLLLSSLFSGLSCCSSTR